MNLAIDDRDHAQPRSSRLAAWLFGVTALTACDAQTGAPPPSQPAQVERASTLLKAGDGRACNAPTVVSIIHRMLEDRIDSFERRPQSYAWTGDQFAEARARSEYRVEAVTFEGRSADTHAVSCEADASGYFDGDQVASTRIVYTVETPLDRSEPRVEIENGRALDQLVFLTTQPYQQRIAAGRAITTQARNDQRVRDFAQICSTYRSRKGQWDKVELAAFLEVVNYQILRSMVRLTPDLYECRQSIEDDHRHLSQPPSRLPASDERREDRIEHTAPPRPDDG